MPKKPQVPIRPRDLNQLAVHVGRIATHEVEDTIPVPVSAAAKKRGDARAAKLSAGKRKKIARKAALARWHGSS